MANCPICGARIDTISGYRCSYCDELHCTDHRLPEQHDCPGAARAARLGPDITARKPSVGDGEVDGAPELKPGTGKLPEDAKGDVPTSISVTGFLLRILIGATAVGLVVAAALMLT